MVKLICPSWTMSFSAWLTFDLRDGAKVTRKTISLRASWHQPSQSWKFNIISAK